MNQGMDRNPLGSEKVNRLILKFAIPSIIGMLVGAVYNIVDQLFIGNAVGKLGNAATSVAFPLSTACIALALVFGIGGASSFNIAMGKKEEDKATYYIGNSITMLVVSGLILCLISQLFLRPMLLFFGSSDDILEYALTYVRITSIGFPFLILTSGGGHLIRADGSPRITMICNISGAVINTILDAIFVLGFKWGMFGAALATIIGQIFSGILVIRYLLGYKTVKLTIRHLRVRFEYLQRIISLGMASFFNQIANMIVQIVMNNSLQYYGGLSAYGDTTPLAVSGIVAKVNMIFFAIVIGIAQGTQPIESYNYGAKNFNRVKEAYGLAIRSGGIIAVCFFACFQIFPRTIISFFGKGLEESYYVFGSSYIRIFLFFTFVNFLQPITATFFTSIGKAYKGMFLSLTRQIIFLLPLLIFLPMFVGIDGILYAGPVADFFAALAAILMVTKEFRIISKELVSIEQKAA